MPCEMGPGTRPLVTRPQAGALARRDRLRRALLTVAAACLLTLTPAAAQAAAGVDLAPDLSGAASGGVAVQYVEAGA